MLSSKEIAELQRRFTHHSPLRNVAMALGEQIFQSCPPCHERDVALDNLDAVVMFANAAIARNE